MTRHVAVPRGRALARLAGAVLGRFGRIRAIGRIGGIGLIGAFGVTGVIGVIGVIGVGVIGVIGVVEIAAVPAAVAAPADDGPLVTINASGGNGPNDGLRIAYASGNLQVTRNGVGQLFYSGDDPVQGSRAGVSNFITLAVGQSIVGSPYGAVGVGAEFADTAYLPWDSVSTEGGSATGSGEIRSTLTSPTIAGLEYSVDATFSYEVPNNFVTVSFAVNVPHGATAPVRLYWTGDIHTPGAGKGDQFDVGTPSRMIGVVENPMLAADPDSPQLIGVREINGPFSYVAGNPNCPRRSSAIVTCPLGYGFGLRNGELPNAVDPASNIDNGLMFELGPVSEPGTHEFAVDLVFTTADASPTLSIVTEPPAPTPADDLIVSYVLTGYVHGPPASGLGFSHALPGGLTDATVVSNTCGGTAVASGNLVSLVGGSLAAGTATSAPWCELVVSFDVTSTGSYDLDSGLSVDGLVSAGHGEPMVVSAQAPSAFTDYSLAAMTAGTAYADGVAANGGPAPSYAVTAGSLPPGIGLDAATGALTGTPTVAGSYSFTITATNSGGSISRSFSVTVAPAAPTPTTPTTPTTPPAPTPADPRFVPMSPVRVLDTRSGAPIQGGTSREVVVAGRSRVPSDVTSVVLNVAVTEPVTGGFVTVYPCAAAVPWAANVNFTAGQTTSNTATSGVSAGGKVCIFASTTTHVVVDVNGAYSATRGAARFAAMAPRRLLDTRGDLKVAGGAVRALLIAGRGGVPVDATAVVLNVAVTEPELPGFLTVFPCGGSVPVAANLNFLGGQTASNGVTAAISGTGHVCVFTNTDAHLVVDVNGVYRSSLSSGRFSGLMPARLHDSRESVKVTGGSVREVVVAGYGGVPANASAVVANVAVTDAVADGYLTAFPCGTSRPLAANVNFVAGATVSNAVTVKVGRGGKICLFTTVDAHVVLDVNGAHRP